MNMTNQKIAHDKARRASVSTYSRSSKACSDSEANNTLTPASVSEAYSLTGCVEGGREAWLTILGSFLVYYSSIGLINSFGFFQEYYQTNFLADTESSTIAFVGTLQIALMNLLSTVSGALCDSFGVKWLYIGSGTTTTGALLLLSSTPSGAVWQVFLIQGLLMGIAIAFAVQPALTAAGQHFKARRALAMGVVTVGCALGGVIFPIMFRKLLPVIGFAWVLRVAALKTMLCYSVALYVSTSKSSGKPKKDVLRALFDFKGFLDPRYSTLALGAWGAQFGIWVPNYYIEPYCSIIDPTAFIKGYFLPLINGTSIFGMIVGGLVGDYIGCLNLLWPVTFILGLLCSVWLLSTSIFMLIIYSCLFGFCSGIFVVLLPPAIGQISPDENMGARIGALYSIVAISGLTGAPIGGALIKDETREGYAGIIIYAGVTLMVGALVMLGSRLLHDRDLRAKW